MKKKRDPDERLELKGKTTNKKTLAQYKRTQEALKAKREAIAGTAPTSIRLPEDMKAALIVLAKRMSVPYQVLIRIILAEYIGDAKRDVRRKKTG